MSPWRVVPPLALVPDVKFLPLSASLVQLEVTQMVWHVFYFTLSVIG